MNYEIFSSNNSILQSFTIHPKIATADLISRFEGEGITSAFLWANPNVYTFPSYIIDLQSHKKSKNRYN